MISIYTHTNNPFKKEFWKWISKRILRKYSGPDAVLDSLKRGLTELQVPFEINPLKPKYKTIHVLSGKEILKERIQKKKPGELLLAGPTIVLTPLDSNKLLLNQDIDIVLTPSLWVKNFYISLTPSIADHTYPWPAGVEISKQRTDKTGKILVYKKNIDTLIYKNIINIFKKNNILFETLEYGNFSHKEYIKKLKKTPLIIYLQSSESQGLALQEAWAHDVPTLVYKNTIWSYKNYVWNDKKISAPYLTEETGSFFDLNSLLKEITIIRERKLNPQKYCSKKLSDTKSVEILFDIIKQHNEKNY